MVISNHNSFRVVFDKIASAYFIWKMHLYFSIGNGQPRKPQHRADCIGTLSFSIGGSSLSYTEREMRRDLCQSFTYRRQMKSDTARSHCRRQHGTHRSTTARSSRDHGDRTCPDSHGMIQNRWRHCITSRYITRRKLLPQTDRATRYVSENVVSCGNKLYDKSTTNRSNGVRGLHSVDL